MKKNGRYFRREHLLSLAQLTPLVMAAMLIGCDDEHTPAEPYEAPPLTDAERDTSGGSNVEWLDRGLVVLPAEEGGNALSWRWSGLDEQRVVFKVFKNEEFFRTVRPGEPTFLEDGNGLPDDVYHVEALVDGVVKDTSDVVRAQNKPYLSIPLNNPKNGFVDGVEYAYSANDASAVDLTGDGRYELIVKWEPDNAQDNSKAGKTGDVLVDAYTMDGEFMWRINLGKNIRAGAHYTQFIAYDFNQDGRAEVAMKTADGTIDGRGNVIGDATADHRNDGGYVLDGPEFLSMFDGISGEVMSTVDYVPPRGENIEADWGDGYGNRVDRFLAGVAYLDGATPSLVMSRGYYERAVVAAFDLVGSELTLKWVYDTHLDESDDSLYGQGAHSLSVADVDGDGRDEIIFGAATLDDDGTALYNTGLGHGDALHVADIIPDNPGLEVFMVHEDSSSYINDEGNFGVEVHDAATGAILLSQPSNGPGDDVGRGATGDIDPNYPGMESWGARGGMIAADGTIISQNKPAMNFMIWWDGDLNREMLDGTWITKWNAESLLVEKTPLFDAGTFSNGLAVSNNSTKATPALSADILGDWREEVVFANEASTRLMVYSSNIPTDVRLPTLMHDRQYRTAIAWQNVGYNQPPHPSFALGSDMQLYDHVVKELPQFKTQAVVNQPVTRMVAQGNNKNVLVKVYPGEANVSSIEVFRGETDDRGSATSVGVVSGGTSFVDESAVPDKTFYYWVEATDSSGNAIPGLEGPSKTRMTSTLIPRVEVASSNNYVDLTWVTELNLSDVYIYRAETTEFGSVPVKPTASYAHVNGRAKTWTDGGTEEGRKYYYWVELVTQGGDVVNAEPAFGENLVLPETNLDYTWNGGDVLTICWNLENVEPGIIYSELLRNTADQASGRSRIHQLHNDEVYAGCFDDNGPEGGFVDGQGYWYMFKHIPAWEIVGPFKTQTNLTNLHAALNPELNTIDLTWELRNFGADIVKADLYRSNTSSMSNKTLVRGGVRVTDGRVRDTGGVDGFSQGETYWYAFDVSLADGTVVATQPEGEVLFELPEPETNLITRLEDGGIRIDWNLENFPDEITNIELLRNMEATSTGAVVVASETLERRGVFAEYDGLVEGQTYWYMMRVTMASGEVVTGEPSGEIVYEQNPMTTSVTLNENDDGYCGISNGAIESNWAGYDGDGFSNTDNAEGEYIAYKVNIREAGTYRLLLRYANGAGDNRWGRVAINNQTDIARIDMESTGAWDAWMESHADVELEIGEAEIKLVAATGGGLGNVDYLVVNALTTDVAPQGVACGL